MKNYVLYFIAFVFTFMVLSCSKSKEPGDVETGIKNPKEPEVDNSSKYHDKTFKGISGSVMAAALQPDGKVIVIVFGGGKESVYRLTVDGEIDKTFDIDVNKTWQITSGSVYRTIDVLSDGKILLGGEYVVNGVSKFFIRLTATGDLDNSFVQPTTISSVRTTAKLANGQLLVAGRRKAGNSTEPCIIRLNVNGSVDNTFGFSVNRNDFSLDAIFPLDNGQFLVGGTFRFTNGNGQTNHIARVNANGTLDPTFNFTGEFTSNIFGSSYVGVNKLAVQSDGKILVTGAFSSIEYINIRDSRVSYNSLARLNTNGTLDQSLTDITGYRSNINGIAVLPDNRFLIARGVNLVTDALETYLKLFSKDGVADEGFKFGYPESSLHGILKQPGKGYLIYGNITDKNKSGILRVKI